MGPSFAKASAGKLGVSVILFSKKIDRKKRLSHDAS